MERSGFAKLRRGNFGFMLLMSGLILAGVTTAFASIIALSGGWSITLASLAFGASYWTACWLTFRKFRRLTEWRDMAQLVNADRFAEATKRALELNVLLYLLGMVVVFGLTSWLEPRLTAPGVWDNGGLVPYKVIAASVAFWHGSLAVKMVCRAQDYAQVRKSGGLL